MLDTVLGLPVHALIVHGVVVVVPLVAVAAVAVAAYGPWRRRLALPLAALALGMTGLAWVATESGEALNERLGLPDVARRHTELGDSLPIFVFSLTVALVVLGVLARRQAAAKTLVAVGVVLVLATAGLLTWRAVLVGHSGTAAVWGEIVANTQAPAG